MDHLDREEIDAEQFRSGGLEPSEVLAYLRDLPGLFEQAEPETRRNITRALFDRVEVLGPSEVWLYPSVEAERRGWATAMAGDFRYRIESRSGRGERI